MLTKCWHFFCIWGTNTRMG